MNWHPATECMLHQVGCGTDQTGQINAMKLRHLIPIILYLLKFKNNSKLLKTFFITNLIKKNSSLFFKI